MVRHSPYISITPALESHSEKIVQNITLLVTSQQYR